jgi:mRNA interferase YafQ
MGNEPMLNLKPTTQYKKDRKRVIKRGFPIIELDEVIELLQKEKALDPKYRDHALSGNYEGFRECHIQPDWLFIYAIDGENLILIASRTGSHSDLF